MIEAKRAPKLRGVIAPVLTPFHRDLSVDYQTWERLIVWLIEQSVDALFVSGGSGEWTQLTVEERIKLTRRAVVVTAGEIPVIAGSLGRDFDETLRLSDRMASAGADYLGIAIPRFVQPSRPSLYAPEEMASDPLDILRANQLAWIEEAVCGFFERLHLRLPCPTMLYDPQASGEFALQPWWLRRLARIDGVVGLKESTRDLRRFTQLTEAAGEGFAMLAGDETVMLPCLVVGAVGCVGGGASVFPELLRDVFDAFDRGDREAAQSAHYALERANRVMELGSWPLTGKIALAARGLPVAPVTRVQSSPLAPGGRGTIEAFFRQVRLDG